MSRIAWLHGAAMVVAAALVLVGLFVLSRADQAPQRLVLILVLAALLVMELVLFRRQTRAEALASGDEADIAGAPLEEEPPWGPAAEAAPGAGREQAWPSVAIRCSRCQQVFRVADSGLRPLTVVCSNCGKQGVIRGKTHA